MSGPENPDFGNEETPPRDLEDELLTDREKERVQRLRESGQFSRQEALRNTVSKSKYDRIIGAEAARRIAEEAARSAEARRREQADNAPQPDEAVELMRGTFPPEETQTPPDEPDWPE